MRRVLLGLVAALLLPAGVWAQPAAADLDPAAASVPPATAVDAGPDIETMMERFIAENGYGERERRGEIAVLRGSAIVDVPSSSPQFIGQRSLAFQAAMLNAQADYVVRQNAQLTNQTLIDMFRAANQEPPPFTPGKSEPPGKIRQVLEKLLEPGAPGGENALKEIDVDPAAYAAAPASRRYTQVRSAMLMRTTTRAFGELVGLMPVQSFEKPIGGDAYKVGVVAVVSPRMKELAQRVLRDRGQFAPEPARAGKLAALVGDTGRLVRDFGVRWRYDEAGLPVLVSYYQWMSDYRGQDPITAERFREIAFRQAEQGADGQIADFLAGSVNVVRVSEAGREALLAADRQPDGYIAQQAEVRRLLNGHQDTIRRESRATISGLSTLSRWSEKHPDTGQPIFGVVRVWSAAGEQSARAQRDGRGGPARTPSGPGVGQTGRKLMDSSDF